MRIGCICGNVLRDQADFIPFKAWMIPDQDLDDLANSIGDKIARNGGEDPSDIVYSAILQWSRNIYQCRNCGRMYFDDPDQDELMQVFRPETGEWKKVLASSKGEGARAWRTNLVAHWDSDKAKGELWFDPAPAEKGGYETFADRGQLEARYYRLFDSMRGAGNLQGARFGFSAGGKDGEDVHGWSASAHD